MGVVMDEMQAIPLHVDFDKDVFRFANAGINRAYAFAGLIFNPLNKIELNDYHLPNDENINIYLNISG